MQHSPHTPTQMPADPKGANAMHAPLNYVYVERSKAYNSVIDSLGCPFQIIIDTNSLACTIIYRESIQNYFSVKTFNTRVHAFPIAARNKDATLKAQ